MKYTLKVPTIPNFIQAQVGENQLSIPIAELDDEDIDWLAAQWKAELMEARGLRARRLADREETR